QVVQVAVVLHGVTDAVAEEIRRRAVAANDHLIAVVLSLVVGDAGNVAHHFTHAHHQLIVNLLFRDHGDGLWHVAYWCRDPGAAADQRAAGIRGRADAHAFLDPSDGQHEFAAFRIPDEIDLASDLDEAVSRDRDGVAARLQPQGELT